MNLQVLANIGEFLGGLAILVSLIYVVLSIRQNTVQLQENLKSLQRTEKRAAYEQHDRYRLATLDRDLAQLLLQGIAGELTDRVDKYRFNNLMIMMTYSSQNNWDLVQAGLDEDEDQWNRIATGVAALYDSEGGKRWWERARYGFRPDFVEAVETHRRTG
jgi:hypothetical protein